MSRLTTKRQAIVVVLVVAGLTAIGLQHQAIAGLPSEGQSHLEKAEALQKKGDVPGAIIELKNAVHADPELSQARYELGVLYVQVGDPSAAQRELEAARERGFDAAKILPPLLQAYVGQARYQDVIKNFNPSDFSGETQSVLLAAQARAQIALSDLPAAHKLIDRALAQSPTLPPVLIAAASLARTEQKFDDAEKYVDQGLAADPDNGELLVFKGEARQMANDLDGAIEYLNHAVEKHPQYSRARVARGLANLRRGKPDLVKVDVSDLLTRDAQNPLGIYLNAFLLSQDGKSRDATQALLTVPQLLDNYPPARYLLAASYLADNQLQSAMSNAELYLRKAPKDFAGSKLLAAIALRMNDSKRAVEVLEPFAQAHNDDKQFRLQLASAYLGAGRSEEATKLFEAGLKEDPQNPETRMALAISELRAGAQDAGVEQLQELIKTKPDSLQANALLVLTNIQNHHLDKALAAAEAMIKAAPKDPNAYNLRGTVNLAANDPVAAKVSFKAALDQDAKFVPAFLNLARIEEGAKNFNGAKEWYQKALTADPGNLTAFGSLANIALRDNKTDDAEKIMEQAIAANPKNPEPRLTVIDLFLRTEQAGRALVAARDFVNVLPDEPRAVDALGRAQLGTGDFVNGLGTYRKLAAMLPNNAEAERRLGRALMAAAIGKPDRAVDGNEKAAPADVQQPALSKFQNPALATEAKDTFDKAIELAPDYIQALVDRLALERTVSGDAAALTLAQKLIQQRPESVPRLIVAGDLETGLGKNDAAATHYRAAWDKNKNKNDEILTRLYGALVRQKKGVEGLQTLTKWAAENPKDYKIRFLILSAYISDGRVDDAIKETESMNGALPDNPVLLNNLAWLYGEKNNPRAFDIGQRALALAPDSPEVMDTLGWLEVKKRDLKKGTTLLASSYAKEPKNPSIGYHYAAALKQSGDQAQAKEVLKKALQANAPFKERTEAEALLKELGG